MSLTALYKLGAIVTPAGTIGQITRRTISPGIEAALLKGDGRLSAPFMSTMSQRPAISFTSQGVEDVLSVLSGGFYQFTSATDLFLTKLISGGGVGGAGVHAKLSLARGCIIPRVLEARHGSPAELSCDIYGISANGTTNPLSYTASVSLPTNVTGQGYTLGPVKINGTTFSGVDLLRIEFGYRELVQNSDGEVFPTFGCYNDRTPRITIGSKDPTLLESVIGVAGVTQGATASTFYFAKLADEGGTRVANGTAEHIKLTCTTKGFYHGESLDESDDSESILTVNAQPLDDGTNDILIVNLASAIT